VIDRSVQSLSRVETSLLASWERSGRAHVTSDQILADVPDHDPYVLASSLVRKGLLHRVAPGVFLIRAMRTAGRPWSPTAVAATAALLANETYYLGGWWALSFHRLTQQVYGSVLDAFVSRRRRRREVPGTRTVFHVLPQSAFTWGVEETLIESERTMVSDRERTILDAIEHPSPYATIRAGLVVVQDALRTAEFDRQRLIEYALRAVRPSTRARLGVLLEDANTPERLLHRLEQGPRVGKETLVSLIPGGARRGKVRARWSVLDNRDTAA
jgi:predicted transcriptional regulator of viral defense system